MGYFLVGMLELGPNSKNSGKAAIDTSGSRMIFLGIDSGTQSTKCIALDTDSGHVVAEAQEGYEMISGLSEGHLEQEPRVWIEACETTISSCLSQLGERKNEVRGIGVSGQQHGLVVLDADKKVIRPAKLWCDTSTVEQCAQFEEAFGGTTGLIKKGGNAMLPGYTAPKIAWLKQNEPDHFSATKHVLLPHDYINFWLTGELRMEYGDASGTGLMDVRTRTWCEDLINFIDPAVNEMLPELSSSTSGSCSLKPELAEKFGLTKDIVVSAGGGDNMMGAIGTGNVTPGIVTASFGTSGTLYACSDRPIVDPKGEVAAFCDSTDQWLPLVCTMNVTVATEQVREMFGWEISELERAVSSTKPGAEGLTFLPYLNGERTPNLPNASGSFFGLKPSNMTPQHLARAAMEGATLGLAYGLGRLRELGVTPTEIRLTGGGSKSAIWRQIAADCFGVPVVTLATAEGAGLGAAIQAAFASGDFGSDLSRLCDQWVALDDKTRAEPLAENVALYQAQLEKFSSLTSLLAANQYL